MLFLLPSSPGETGRIPITQFIGYTTEERSSLIASNTVLREGISLLETEIKRPLIDALKSMDPELQKKFQFDLSYIMRKNDEEIIFALMSDESFASLTLAKLKELKEGNKKLFIIKQRALILFSKNLELRQQPLQLKDDLDQTPIIDLLKFDSATINKTKEKLPYRAFGFFENDQIRGVDLEGLEDLQLAYLFEFDQDSKQPRFALFDRQRLEKLVASGKLRIQLN